MQLNVKALALTSGILWAVGLFGITWWIIAFDGPSSDPTWVGRVYRGYRLDATGSLIGLLWALPDGFIGGAIFGWVYNALVKCRPTDA